MSTPDTTTYRDAIRDALADSMREDDRIVVFGEDIAAPGGAFKTAAGLLDEFGENRVWDTPISETAIVGSAIGLALGGYRPVADLMFADFVAVAFDQLVNQAAKFCFVSGGKAAVPMVVRCTGGGGFGFGAQHSQTTESWFLGQPGLKAVVPATPQDGYSLMRAAIRDPGPVMFIEHKGLYGSRGPVDRGLEMEIGRCGVERQGSDVTVVASLAMVGRAMEAAARLESDGIDVEVVDLRSVAPLDVDGIAASVAKTGRIVTVEEQPLSGGWGAQILAGLCERLDRSLSGRVARLGLPEAPLAFSPILEREAIPSVERIADAVKRVVKV
jgi:pyruvate dehydrogenase E1 component beta subunit